jgi:adenylate kinase
MRLVFLGPPGAGKGTQAGLVARKLGIPQISTGDILRDAVARGTDLGRQARGFMESGGLVPDEVMLGLVEDRLGHSDCAKGFVLDGYPRTLAQATALDKMLERGSKTIDGVVFIDLGDEVVVGRLAHRRVCPQCKALYNLGANPPAKEGLCDRCGVALATRADDGETTIRTRLRVYRNETLPLVEYYGAKGILKKIDGEGKVEDVFAAIMEEISEVRQN